MTTTNTAAKMLDAGIRQPSDINCRTTDSSATESHWSNDSGTPKARASPSAACASTRLDVSRSGNCNLNSPLSPGAERNQGRRNRSADSANLKTPPRPSRGWQEVPTDRWEPSLGIHLSCDRLPLQDYSIARVAHERMRKQKVTGASKD